MSQGVWIAMISPVVESRRGLATRNSTKHSFGDHILDPAGKNETYNEQLWCTCLYLMQHLWARDRSRSPCPPSLTLLRHESQIEQWIRRRFAYVYNDLAPSMTPKAFTGLKPPRDLAPRPSGSVMPIHELGVHSITPTAIPVNPSSSLCGL